MQTQDLYSGLAQPNLRSLSSNFNLKFEVLLIQDFQTKPSNNLIGLWFQYTILDLWLQIVISHIK